MRVIILTDIGFTPAPKEVVSLRSPRRDIWDRDNNCLHFWDGRTVCGDLHAVGGAWVFQPERELHTGADLLILLPLRRLVLARHSAAREWRCTLAVAVTHPAGGLAVTDRYASVTVKADGTYVVADLGDLADAMHQQTIPEAEAIQLLRALDVLLVGLSRTHGSVTDLLTLWDVPGVGSPT